MKRSRMNSACMGLWLALAVAAVGVPLASAQQAGGPRPPAPSDEPSGAAFSASAIGLILAAMVLGAAGMKSKRSHQD